MRFPRVKAESQSFYDCVSSVVDGRFIFRTTRHGSTEAESFLSDARIDIAHMSLPIAYT